jgi:nucleoside-diphosphate-sugar epimerase
MTAIDHGKVCIFGAGGPVGAVAADSLRDHYTLRLTDLLAIEDITRPQKSAAPLPVKPVPPHEWRQVDITDYQQVLEAARGMDALINVSVLRDQLVPAFGVNMVGAYNVMKAAVECGITRVIHTGPRHVSLQHEADYWNDFDVSDDAPLHPGTDLYALSKYLGGQIVRVFAEEHGLEVITFLYCHFRPADGGEVEDGTGIYPFSTSWEDTGEAFRYGLRATDLPSPHEVFDIVATLPHGKFSNEKTQRLLGWAPKHNFERLYRRGRRP